MEQISQSWRSFLYGFAPLHEIYTLLTKSTRRSVMNTLTIAIENEVLQAYTKISPEEQEKVQLLINCWLKNLLIQPMTHEYQVEVLQNISQHSQLTPEQATLISKQIDSNVWQCLKSRLELDE
jgi:hypothetical protein